MNEYMKITALLAILALMGGCQTSARENGDRKPNIVLIVTDDIWEHEFGFRNPEFLTPTIDMMATEGLYFKNTYTSPVCSPARYSILSGKLPSNAQNITVYKTKENPEGQTYVVQNSKLMPGEYHIARVLADNGYFTGICGKTDGISKEQNFHSIDKDDNPDDPAIAEKLAANQEMRIQFMKDLGFGYAGSLYRGNIQTAFSTRKNAIHNMEWVTRGALNFLDKKADKPFFLAMCPTLMHSPDEYKSFMGDPRATEAGTLEEAITGVQDSRESVTQRISEAGLNPEQACPMLWLDDGIRAVMDKVKEIGEWENTLFVFINDNSHEEKGTPFEGGVRTEMFLFWPNRIQKGKAVDELAMNIDIAATIYDIAGISSMPESYSCDGKSLKPFFIGQPEKWRESVFVEYGFTKGVVKGKYKYLANRLPAGMDFEEMARKDVESSGRWSESIGSTYTPVPKGAEAMGNAPGHLGGNSIMRPVYEYNAWKVRPDCYFDADKLFDLSRDPLEQNNLAGNPEYADILEDMKQELSKQLKNMPGKFAEF